MTKIATPIDNAAVEISDVVGQWKEPIGGTTFICPGGRDQPDPCGCAYVGYWHHRWVYTWQPGKTRTDRMIRRDLRRGLPAQAGNPGCWVVAGYDERCPNCGDIERFNLEADFLGGYVERAKILSIVADGSQLR